MRLGDGIDDCGPDAATHTYRVAALQEMRGRASGPAMS